MDLRRRLPIIAFGAAALTLILVVVNAVMILENQKAETKVQQRQQFINQSVQLNQVRTALLQMLGSAALNSNDESIKSLLTEFGVTVTPNAPAAGQAPPAPAKSP